ncbi:phosphodiesterase [Plakobranchus ocellatus]|uniref:Phosphodiesterase n=1 Tax=Plakobranchus ocellatus TaxID=259542 RepID=A0AAV4BU84_9GAST|nr:phosphodiesterase [Plakobranchus ocellatus]
MAEQYTLSQETVDYLKQPTFDIWHWEPNEMLSLLEHMYHELGLVEEFNINPIVLKRWLGFGFLHIASPQEGDLRLSGPPSGQGAGGGARTRDRRLPADLREISLATVPPTPPCAKISSYNDYSLTNSYQINARTELAIRYNDISPLENHHCAVAFQILSNPETNIFANVDKDTFKRIRAVSYYENNKYILS